MYEKPKKLLDQVRETMRIKHYSYRTEQSYVDWIRRYIFSMKGAIRWRWADLRSSSSSDFWQYVFPGSKRSIVPMTRVTRRHHLDENVLQGEIRKAALQLGMTKRGSQLTFRHSFAARLLENAYDIRTVLELLGHKDVKGTMIIHRSFTTFRINSGQAYTHMLNRGTRVS